MEIVNVTIDDKIAKNFRDTVFQKYGQKDGKIGKSIMEAMHDYTTQYSKTKSKENQEKLPNRKSYSNEMEVDFI